MLRALHIKDVGPAAEFDLELGERLNVLTGDNGLGKSFVLEVAWWALTGTWVDRPVLPQRGKEESAEIGGETEDDARFGVEKTFRCRFDRVMQQWTDRYGRDGMVGFSRSTGINLDVPDWITAQIPVLYVRPDGFFDVWDPARFQASAQLDRGLLRSNINLGAFHFSQDELWNGLKQDDKPVCNGLIQDWFTWQLQEQIDPNKAFHILCRVLDILSHPEEPMKAGNAVRLYLDDVRWFPTIDLPYGNVPVVHASAGMKRILGLAYLVTWMWTEHVQACSMLGWKPAEQIAVLFEEPETHLHPKWQRHIVPALLEVMRSLSPNMRPQILLTTHSPLVLASLEPHFDREKDRLFNFELKNQEVVLEELPWVKYGDASGWLASDVFDIKSGGRSTEAERAIGAAYDFMAGKLDRLPEGLKTADEINARLRNLLDGDDPFWPRWRFFRNAG